MNDDTSWHDLYWHGKNLAYVCKGFRTKYKHAVERDDEAAMMIWAEGLRKMTNDCVAIAKTVLGVEEIVKGKRITA